MDTTTMKDSGPTFNTTTSITSNTTAIRTESIMPFTVRRVIYPNGRIALQGGYQWTEGSEGGIAWRDLPLINVGIDGQEE